MLASVGLSASNLQLILLPVLVVLCLLSLLDGILLFCNSNLSPSYKLLFTERFTNTKASLDIEVQDQKVLEEPDTLLDQPAIDELKHDGVNQSMATMGFFESEADQDVTINESQLSEEPNVAADDAEVTTDEHSLEAVAALYL